MLLCNWAILRLWLAQRAILLKTLSDEEARGWVGKPGFSDFSSMIPNDFEGFLFLVVNFYIHLHNFYILSSLILFHIKGRYWAPLFSSDVFLCD
jgi:hypothetical protein